MFAYLLHVAELHQIGQQPVTGAARNAQLVRQRAQRLPLWSCRQIFENLKRTLGGEDMVCVAGAERFLIMAKLRGFHSKWNNIPNGMQCRYYASQYPHRQGRYPPSIPVRTLLYRRDCPCQRRIRASSRASAQFYAGRAGSATIKFGHLNNP